MTARTLITASIALQGDRYNHTLRATVPGCWVVRLDTVPESLRSVSGVNIVPEWYGNTREEAIRNTATGLQSLGLSGSLRLHP